MSESTGSSADSRFRRMEPMVLPQMAKRSPLKRREAQQTKEIPMHSVLPLLTAPSHITASRSLYGEESLHQVSASS